MAHVAQLEELRRGKASALADLEACRQKLTRLAEDHSRLASALTVQTVANAALAADLAVAQQAVQAVHGAYAARAGTAARSVAALEVELAAARQALERAVEQTLAARAHAPALAAAEAALEVAAHEMEAERSRSREVEGGLRSSMGSLLAIFVHKLTSAVGEVQRVAPGAVELLYALEGLSAAEGSEAPLALEDALAALDSLPALASWFAAAGAGLSDQVDSRLLAAVGRADAMAERLVGLEVGVADLAQARQTPPPAPFRSTPAHVVHEGVLVRMREERDAALTRANAAETSLAELRRKPQVQISAGADSTHQSGESPSSGFAVRNPDLAHALSPAARERLLALERDRAAEAAALRERLVIVLRRLEYSRTVSVPAHVRDTLAGEVDRVAGVVKGAAALARSCKAIVDRVGVMMRTGPLAGGGDSGLRAGLTAHAAGLTSVAEAATRLGARLQRFANASVLAASDAAVESTHEVGAMAVPVHGSQPLSQPAPVPSPAAPTRILHSGMVSFTQAVVAPLATMPEDPRREKGGSSPQLARAHDDAPAPALVPAPHALLMEVEALRQQLATVRGQPVLRRPVLLMPRVPQNGAEWHLPYGLKL
jgi:hypothetical protein